jgi:hypothetical protein
MAIQIIRASERAPSTAAQFAQAFGNAAGNIGEAYFKHKHDQEKKKKEEEEKRDFEERTLMGKERLLEKEYGLKGDLEETKQKANRSKELEKTSSLKNALETVDRMESIGKRGNLGIGTSIQGLFSSEARKDQGEYEQLGKSLIQYATNIPIRNRLEFETLAEQLYDPSVSDAKRKGILKAMRRIIQNSLNPHEELRGGQQENSELTEPMMNKRPPLSSFRGK